MRGLGGSVSLLTLDALTNKCPSAGFLLRTHSICPGSISDFVIGLEKIKCGDCLQVGEGITHAARVSSIHKRSGCLNGAFTSKRRPGRQWINRMISLRYLP